MYLELPSFILGNRGCLLTSYDLLNELSIFFSTRLLSFMNRESLPGEILTFPLTYELSTRCQTEFLSGKTDNSCFI